MAVIPFARQSANIEGDVYRCTPLAAGDESGVLTVPNGNCEVTVHVYGTVGGATVTIAGSLLGVQFNTLEDAYGVAMSYTAVGVVRPVGPGVVALKAVVTGGTDVVLTVDVYIVRKVR